MINATLPLLYYFHFLNSEPQASKNPFPSGIPWPPELRFPVHWKNPIASNGLQEILKGHFHAQ